MIKCVVFVFASLLPVVAVAQSISSVSGTWADGDTITINGSSFGTKSPAAPAYFSDFEDLVVGEMIEDGWSQPNDLTVGVLGTDAYAYSGSRSLMIDTYYNEHTFHQVIRDLGAHSEDFYFATRLRIGDETACGPGQFKAWMVSSSPGVYTVDEDTTYGSRTTRMSNLFHLYDGTPDYWGNTGYITYSGATLDGGSLGRYSRPDITSYGFSMNEWMSIENTIIGSSSSGSDDGVYLMQRVGHGEDLDNQTDVVTWIDGDAFYRYVMIGQTWLITYDCDIYYDDMYIDITAARVMLGDNSTWGACTVRDHQIPTLWSPTSIQVEVNNDSFSADDTAYLFVVDADGNVSDGYAITIGASESASITAPTNLAATRTP